MKRKKKAKKEKRFPMLGRSLHDRLYRAVVNYVEAHGGSLIVIGGIDVQQFPTDRVGNFRVAVRCTGRPPVFKPKPSGDNGSKT